MRTFTKIATGFLGLAFAIASLPDANAQSRSGGGTGPRGNSYTTSGSGSCSGGSCTSNQSVTGPKGNSATRDNSASCSGGSCTTSHTGTGPAGKTVTRGNKVSR